MLSPGQDLFEYRIVRILEQSAPGTIYQAYNALFFWLDKYPLLIYTWSVLLCCGAGLPPQLLLCTQSLSSDADLRLC